uniref:Beta-glucosidase 1 n=1 Tax=Ananas comosus var. bracteatus TaxID=296719 RepID=A0A6V7Q5R7_ANACO|nr:unnamed protein product [Ananas comosus var. bracteatus]
MKILPFSLVLLFITTVSLAVAEQCEADSGALSRASFPRGSSSARRPRRTRSRAWPIRAVEGPVSGTSLIPNNATGEVTVDEYQRYKEDVNIMKKMGFDTYRFSISWSRIFPEGAGKVNWVGVEYYDRLINYMLEQGITPYANLYHYDMPLALENEYMGWLSPRVVEAFADYADFCFKMYGDRVKNWFTFNEPRVVAALGYDNGFHAPGRCTGCPLGGDSATEPYIVAHHLLLSHATAVKRYREKYQTCQKGKIGILLDFVWYEGLTNSTADQDAARRARDFHVHSPYYIRAIPESMRKIVKERLPNFTCEEVEMVKGSADYIGINQYTTYYVKNFLNTSYLSYSNDWHVEFLYERNGVPVGQRAHSDWLYIVPWGLYKAVTYIKENYGSPIMLLSENGMDQPGNVTLPGALNDAQRINYYKSYITELKKAIDDGADVRGYFAWSLLDNFEWRLGYTSRFGIVYVDFKTLKRYPKNSAYWFKNMIQRKN